jgi:hypothetical protein
VEDSPPFFILEDIMAIERYRARSGAEVSQQEVAAEAAVSGYTIEIQFLGGLSAKQKAAFKHAANRWTRAIIGDLPDVILDGQKINNLRISAQGAPIDGEGGVLGQAGPGFLRPKNAGAAAFLPATGEMQFDTADLDAMEADGTLDDVITHEMGHVIGIGTIWTNKKLLKGSNTSNPTFIGTNAMREYGKLRSAPGPLPVPVENKGGEGTANSHWRDAIFDAELMTGFVNVGGNPMSALTIASLQDLGYTVDMTAAEPYHLPNHTEMAEAAMEHAEKGIMLGRIPMTLPDESLAP